MFQNIIHCNSHCNLLHMSGLIQPANSRTAMDVPTPNTNKLCITLGADYLNGKIGKDNAIRHILKAFRELDVYERATPVQIQTAISAYIRMLDQAKSAREVAALQGRGAWQVQGDIAEEEQRGSPVSIGPQPEDAGAAVEYGIDELWGTPNLETSLGRRGADKTMFTWARDKDSEINVLTPSQELTHKLIWNQMINIKVMKHNLFSVRGLPEFPDSKWVKVLQEKVVDLDVIISVIHSTITDNWATETFRDFEFQFGHLKPTKTVRNHGDWLIMYSAFQHAMWFIYPHRESELIWYSEYITAYFASADAGGQNQVLNLNKAIWCWSGSVNNMLLDQFEKFRFLKVQHIFSKAAGDQGVQGNQWGLSTGQHGGVSTWQSKDLCWLFNQGKCGKQASEFQYRHVCIRCGKEGHAKKECASKKAWAIMCKGQETEVCQEISMESQWWGVRTDCWVFTHCKAFTTSKSNGREWPSEAGDDIELTWSI